MRNMGGEKEDQPVGVITLRGSTETVVEFFGFAINSILYQRGVYPHSSFKSVPKYGLPMLVTTDPGLQRYLAEVLQGLHSWMLRCEVHKLVLVVTSEATGLTLERWAFDIQVDKENCVGEVRRTQAEAVTEQKEIQAIIRQICASVTFLPLLDESCTFDLLVYADREAEVPTAWAESDPKYITGGSQEVKLRSFTTKIHRVEGFVSYRFEDAGA